MNKKEVLEFLDRVENKAVKSVEEKYNNLVAEEKERLIKILLLDKNLQEIQVILNQVNDVFIHTMDRINESGQGVTYNFGYGGVEYYLNNITGQTKVYDSTLKKLEFENATLLQFKKDREAEIQEVKKNYHIVRSICKEKRNGVLAAEYLEGIGFDLSAIRAPKNEVVERLDISKLFVCGDNK